MKSRRITDQRGLSRKDMQRIIADLSAHLPGKKFTLVMPGEPVPEEFRPKKKK